MPQNLYLRLSKHFCNKENMPVTNDCECIELSHAPYIESDVYNHNVNKSQRKKTLLFELTYPCPSKSRMKLRSPFLGTNLMHVCE